LRLDCLGCILDCFSRLARVEKIKEKIRKNKRKNKASVAWLVSRKYKNCVFSDGAEGAVKAVFFSHLEKGKKEKKIFESPGLCRTRSCARLKEEKTREEQTGIEVMVRRCYGSIKC
jgi:hypothetical protein